MDARSFDFYTAHDIIIDLASKDLDAAKYDNCMVDHLEVTMSKQFLRVAMAEGQLPREISGYPLVYPEDYLPPSSTWDVQVRVFNLREEKYFFRSAHRPSIDWWDRHGGIDEEHQKWVDEMLGNTSAGTHQRHERMIDMTNLPRLGPLR